MQWQVLPVSLLVGVLECTVVAQPAVTRVQAAAPATAVIPGSQVWSLEAQANHAKYQLTVIVPPSYAKESSRRYPVLYLMDGNQAALLAGFVFPRMWSTNLAPEVIVVGVGYPGSTERALDYGPTSQTYWKMPAERGAANFMRAMQQDIIPFVERTYRADPTDRAIGGHSMGGLITAYAMIHESSTFKRFWISSPSLFWDHDVVLDEAVKFASQPDPRIRVFADVGGDEESIMQGVQERLRQTIAAAGWKDSAYKLAFVPGQVHSTVPATVFADAMDFIYNDRLDVRLPRARLAELCRVCNRRNRRGEVGAAGQPASRARRSLCQ